MAPSATPAEICAVRVLGRCLELATQRDDEDAYSYALPFRFGERYRIGQGYGGTASHRHELFYSLDFDMPERTVLCAAREGRVVDVVDHYHSGGWDRSYLSMGNQIIISHPDGSAAHYVHLVHRGSWVSIGDLVRRGEPIGLSGNTGYSQGPHLHFHVVSPSDGRLIPTGFATSRSDRETPYEGSRYAHPGDDSSALRGARYLLDRFIRPSSVAPTDS